MHDQRGHGQMDGVPREKRSKLFGVIPGYDSFLDDIDAVRAMVKTQYPQIPVVLFGHSMGGNIAINYLLSRNQDDLAGAIFETPWLRLFKPMPAPVVALAKILGKISPRFAITNTLNIGDITRDEERQQDIASDEFYHNHISFRMFSGITVAGEYAITNAQSLKIPALLICAEQDKIVSPDAIKEFKKNAGDNVELVVYADAYHSVHNDTAKDLFFGDIVKFLNQHSKKEP